MTKLLRWTGSCAVKVQSPPSQLEGNVKNPSKNEASVVLRKESACKSDILVGDLTNRAMRKLIDEDKKKAFLSSTYFMVRSVA